MSTNQNNNIKYALCYVPLLAIIINFIETKKDDKLRKHIKIALILFGIYIVLFFLFWIFSFGWLITFIYFIISFYLWYRIYSWEEIDFLKKIENKFDEIFK